MDLHCPVELRGYEMLHDDRRNVRAYLRLGNLSHTRVSRFSAQVAWLNARGERAEGSFQADNLRAPGRGVFTVPISTDQLPDADHLELLFTRVAFEGKDRPDWLASPVRLVELPDVPPPDGRDLNRLMALAGPDVVGYPLRTGRLWLCVCGRANPCRRQRCWRCKRDRDQVLREYNIARVLSVTPMPVPAPMPVELPKPERSARQANWDGLRENFLRQRALLIRRTLAMLALIALIALILWGQRLLAQARKPAESIPPVKIASCAQLE